MISNARRRSKVVRLRRGHLVVAGSHADGRHRMPPITVVPLAHRRFYNFFCRTNLEKRSDCSSCDDVRCRGLESDGARLVGLVTRTLGRAAPGVVVNGARRRHFGGRPVRLTKRTWCNCCGRFDLGKEGEFYKTKEKRVRKRTKTNQIFVSFFRRTCRGEAAPKMD